MSSVLQPRKVKGNTGTGVKVLGFGVIFGPERGRVLRHIFCSTPWLFVSQSFLHLLRELHQKPDLRFRPVTAQTETLVPEEVPGYGQATLTHSPIQVSPFSVGIYIKIQKPSITGEDKAPPPVLPLPPLPPSHTAQVTLHYCVSFCSELQWNVHGCSAAGR